MLGTNGYVGVASMRDVIDRALMVARTYHL